MIRAAAACKPFLRAARSPPFLRLFRRLHPSCCPRLLGCLSVRPGLRHVAPRLSTSSASSSSTAGAVHGGDFALSFLPAGDWPGFASWELLDCRNGRVLLKNRLSGELAVADPMSRGCITLPAPPTERAVGYGLVADDGDSSAFLVVCISRDSASHELRALIASSGELSWADSAGVSCQPKFAGVRPMQANRSLYWKLEGGERMVAFSTATMKFALLDLPPFFRELSFDVMEKGEEDCNVLHLLTMTGFCIEVWAGTRDGDGGIAWRRLDKSVSFHKLVMEVFKPSRQSRQQMFKVVGVAAGVVFVRQWINLFSIDLETMKLKVLSKKDCQSTLSYPYTIAWPPSFLNPTAQESIISQGNVNWELLDCRNGRVLLKNRLSAELAVADPVSRGCITIPAAPTDSAVGYGLVADDGDSSAFLVVCISRDTASHELRALILSSGELSWADVTGVSCQPNFADVRPMQANRSLYWKLEGGERMVAFSTATMEFALLDLPPSLHELSFDVIEKGEEDCNVLHLLTMAGFCIEVWAGTGDGDGGMAWRRVDKSVRFHKLVVEVFKPSRHSYEKGLQVVGVAAGVVFVMQWNNLFSIDLETMKLKVLSKDCPSTLSYPYTIAWPPYFLNPAGQVILPRKGKGIAEPTTSASGHAGPGMLCSLLDGMPPNRASVHLTEWCVHLY
ncbi:hypothetical protein EJB05_33912, partial [Eragrostis curvula]